MKLKGILFFMLAFSSVLIVSMIAYIHKVVRSDSSAEDNYLNSELRDYTARSMGLPTRKPFIYLTETEQCLPPNLAASSHIGDPETCNCDVIVVSYRAKCQEEKQSHISYLFDPNTLFASGRNVLFFAAMDRRPGYHYYIFINDDTVLRYNNFTPTSMAKMSPFRAVEKWLLDYEPAVGVLDYAVHHGAKSVLSKRRVFCGINETSLVLPTVFFDAIFNAFHHKAVEHILPYPTQYEHSCMFASNRDTMIAVEVKFGGQALLFAPVTAGNPKHRKYNRSTTNMTAISREFIERIKQDAPTKLRNHVIFKMFHENPKLYLNKQSRSFCVNVTRRQPIIPYGHLIDDF